MKKRKKREREGENTRTVWLKWESNRESEKRGFCVPFDGHFLLPPATTVASIGGCLDRERGGSGVASRMESSDAVHGSTDWSYRSLFNIETKQSVHWLPFTIDFRDSCNPPVRPSIAVSSPSLRLQQCATTPVSFTINSFPFVRETRPIRHNYFYRYWNRFPYWNCEYDS